jgi:hypothetical protein
VGSIPIPGTQKILVRKGFVGSKLIQEIPAVILKMPLGLIPSDEIPANSTLWRERNCEGAGKRGERYSKAFSQMTVERLKGSENIVALAKELGIHRRLLYIWHDQLEPAGDIKGLPANSHMNVAAPSCPLSAARFIPGHPCLPLLFLNC